VVDLARAVLAPVVQQTRFSFPPEARYSAHRGRGGTAHFARRSVAAESRGNLQDDPDADAQVSARALAIQLHQAPAGRPFQRQLDTHRGTSLSLGSLLQSPRSQVRSHDFN